MTNKAHLSIVMLLVMLTGLMAENLINESFDGETFPPAGWTKTKITGNEWARSANTPNSGPNSGAGLAYYFYSATQNANSWIFSPAVTLESGKTYSVSLYGKTGGLDAVEKMKITYGTAQTAAAQTNLIVDYNALDIQTWTNKRATFTVTTSGSYYLGFQCYSPKDQYYLALDDIKVFETPATPAFEANPAAKTFADCTIGAQSVTQSFTIINGGLASMNVTALRLEGGDAAQFQLTDANTYPFTLAYGATKAVSVKFSPTSAGNKSALIKVVTAGGEYSINLTGRAYAPYVTTGPQTTGFSESFEAFDATAGYFYKDWYIRWSTSNMTAHSGSLSLWLANYTTGSTAVTPRITVSDNDALEFWLQRDAATTKDSVIVAYTENQNNVNATFTPLKKFYIADIPTAYNDANSRKIVDLSSLTGKSVYLAFIGGSYGGSTRMDDVRFFNDQPLSIDNSRTAEAAELLQNYPNPFNPATTISFNLSTESAVKLTVYNCNGELVKELLNENRAAGTHSVNFDASALNSGLYFYKLSANGKNLTSKMVLCK